MVQTTIKNWVKENGVESIKIVSISKEDIIYKGLSHKVPDDMMQLKVVSVVDEIYPIHLFVD